MGTGMVSDLLTHTNTVPVTGYAQVSATHSHTRTHEWCVSFAPPLTRVAHGFGQTRGFCRAGPTGTGPVLDLPTRANTIPVTGNPRVSATRSHARRGQCVASKRFNGE